MKRINLFFIAVIFSISANAQYVLSGKVVNEKSKKPLESVQITLKGTNNGTVSDKNGNFKIETKNKKGVLQFFSLGFTPKQIKFSLGKKSKNLGIVELSPSSYSLDEITISAGLADKTNSPVTVYEIPSQEIKEKLGTQPLPLVLNDIPGVFSTSTGGGTGDAQVSIRGFKQENIGVLINGIPVNGEENGLLYWSNWQGLAEASAKIQVQKGPGVANMAINAVGGSINIETINPSNKKSGTASVGISSFGNTKMTVAINTGKMDNGWKVSFLGSYEHGPGFVDATYVRSWAYYLSATKKINKRNKINITFLGSPQKHGQRTLRLTYDEIRKHGYFFNKDWGGYNGKIKTASENFYHKPFFTLNHIFAIDKGKKLTTTLYIVHGSGGGLWSESFNYAPSIFTYRNASEQIDWNTIYNNNANNTDIYVLANGDTVTGFSKNIQTKFLASHIITGIMSNYSQKLSNGLTFKTGINYKYFNSFLREEVYDLLGGDFFIEDYSWSLAGVSNRNQIKLPGDIVKVDNNSIINFVSCYTQLLFKNYKWNGYISLNGNSNFYKRIDRYNYITDISSDLIVKPGFDVRTGSAYKINDNNKLYINGAYFSKAPYFKYVFGNFNNTPVQNLENEKVTTIEAGYTLNKSDISFSLNGYITSWKNVSMLSNEYIQLEDNNYSRAMVNGLNSLHQGVESTLTYKLNNGWKLSAFASLGNFKWTNDVEATLINNDNIVVDTVFVYAKDLYVGGTAQQQAGANFNFNVFKLINVNAEWIWFGKLYADFNPLNRNNPDDRTQPYKFPDYNIFNMYLNIPFSLNDKQAGVDMGFYNIFNKHYIETGEDGENHDLYSFKGFWNPGFNFNIKLSFYF